ncbi:acetyl/propionyl/methylcrotonyl-CoA carboxylase subunit alpha [Fulvimarina sp. 2208YS6-2-32]|uniref:propionyl-CoA carboxylase n=1 Tax=Fulvimarina uroteuthidis TaxID=3098149 RepID=A0ABU5HZ91_9HYPH|nr:acetyl/propionyl/methylcrotonyl-CoA carboxylase subunit alpha [Fulvimarina sp. 2208YS6-2-32]MDY8108078.1 acetyl/propionyl/methylcrotonyl-CoA carboxylase subunit alpha [Fulvimarina sp. 2208YS6-2-32]
MFKKILIANRGEIACRIMKTARRMGIATVAVYSDADRTAVHVAMADEAVHIGPAQANRSYLLADRIIAACKQTGAEAVHPGYGFLSENASFCKALEAEGIVFIGPKVKAIEAMGDKITSKTIAANAGVSTVPGHMGLIADADEAVKIAGEIGYPVMIKASAGGGGKGMRIAWTDAEAREGFDRSKSEAASSFGDDRIFIEKFVEEPRHIEIQILADAAGNTLYLNERECSIQRRNQKVIEEAPSPFLDAATRKAMGEQSVALARAVDYQSAGTVEFIVDKNRNFYFLEMNTRLQVEHPVTELITGIDLVEEMIRIAAGETLAMTQAEIGIDGWAIESRVYAENPYRGFLPSTGRLTRYRPPEEGQRADGTIVRNDTGVEEGSAISMFYDPMIAKLCTWGRTRETAIDAMAEALDTFVVGGIEHNVPFVTAIMRHPRWRSGDITTGFIAEEYPDGFQSVHPDAETLSRMAIAATLVERLRVRRPVGVEARRLSNVIPVADHFTRVIVLGDDRRTVSLMEAEDHVRVSVDGSKPVTADLDWRPGALTATLTLADRADTWRVDPVTSGLRMRGAGLDAQLKIYPEHIAPLARLMPEKVPADMSKFLISPMPATVMSLLVATGEEVFEGQPLAIIEAMKMENVLRAERSGKVETIAVAEGDSLAVDDVIMEFA